MLGLKDLFENDVFTKLALVIWLVSSAFIVYLLGQIDHIVHSDLYNYGLQFDLAWAAPYWAFARLIYVGLAIPSVISAALLVGGLISRRTGRTLHARTISKPVEKVPNGKTEQLRGNDMVISCPKCKRVFGKPLNMLDFSAGKTRLVNVCPYCNHVLGGADGKKNNNSRIHVKDLDEEVVDEETV